MGAWLATAARRDVFSGPPTTGLAGTAAIVAIGVASLLLGYSIDWLELGFAVIGSVFTIGEGDGWSSGMTGACGPCCGPTVLMRSATAGEAAGADQRSWGRLASTPPA